MNLHEYQAKQLFGEYGIPLPSTAVHSQLYNAMLQMEMAGLDNSAVIGVLEALAGIKLLEEKDS